MTIYNTFHSIRPQSLIVLGVVLLGIFGTPKVARPQTETIWVNVDPGVTYQQNVGTGFGLIQNTNTYLEIMLYSSTGTIIKSELTSYAPGTNWSQVDSSPTHWRCTGIEPNKPFWCIIKCTMAYPGGPGGPGQPPIRWMSVSDIDFDADSDNDNAAAHRPLSGSQNEDFHEYPGPLSTDEIGIIIPINDNNDVSSILRDGGLSAMNYNQDPEVLDSILTIHPRKAGAWDYGILNLYWYTQDGTSLAATNKRLSMNQDTSVALRLKSRWNATTGSRGIEGNSLSFVFIPDSPSAGYTSRDRMNYMFLGCDIDVDSDNSGDHVSSGNNFTFPANGESAGEDFFEGLSGTDSQYSIHPEYKYGMIIPVNSIDADNDGYPDNGYKSDGDWSGPGCDVIEDVQQLRPGMLHGLTVSDMYKPTMDSALSPVLRIKMLSGTGAVRLFLTTEYYPVTPIGVFSAAGQSKDVIGSTSNWDLLYQLSKNIRVEGLRTGEIMLAYELHVNGQTVPIHQDVVRITVMKLDLDFDVDNDGNIDDDDDPLEMNAIGDTQRGPYVNLNNDNDNLNTDTSGNPIEDKDEDGSVANENDLRLIPLTLEPSLTAGYVTLKRVNAKVRIWSDPLKGTSKKILYDNDTKTWDLSDTTQRSDFNSVKGSFYVEGCQLGECVVSAHYQTTSGGQEMFKDEVKITICPGPPKEYPNWSTMSLIMAGGQLHNQWKHFSESTPSDTYRVYIDTSDAGSDPFANGPPSGLTPSEISSTGTYPALDKGYIVKNAKKLGGFLMNFPSRLDEGKKYWVLVRAYDSTTHLESQNRTGYQVQVDYPDLPASNGGRSDLTHLNFYVADCNDVDDIFLIEGGGDVCPVCSRSGASQGATMWRVARTERRESGTEGYYYADDAINLAALKDACEGATGIFAKDKNVFGDWSDQDGNGKFFCLVTGMFGQYGGYSWTWKDLAGPWSHMSDSAQNKSNYSDMVYLNKTVPVDDLKGTFAHELQHNIHGLADPNEKEWVNEGCSMYAEEINGLSTFKISKLAEIPSGETAPRAAKTSLTRFSQANVWNRFGICPRCERDSNLTNNSEGKYIWSAHYEKVAIWTHYLDVNVTHQTGKSIKTLVADTATGIAGVNGLSATTILQNPDGPFVKWTVANYANKVNTNVNDTEYNYTGGWADVGVTPYSGTADGTYIDRVVRNLAADYVKYTQTSGTGSLVVYLKDIDEWDKIIVNAVRLTDTGGYKDVKQLTPQTVSPDVKKYVIPDVFGTDYKSTVIVITSIKDTTSDSYKEEYQIKSQVE